MARPRKQQPVGFGAALVQAREAAGMTLDRAAVLVQAVLGETTGGRSRETIRRMETGAIPEDRASSLFVLALARVYGVPVHKLSPRMAKQIANVFVLAREELEPTDANLSIDIFNGDLLVNGIPAVEAVGQGHPPVPPVRSSPRKATGRPATQTAQTAARSAGGKTSHAAKSRLSREFDGSSTAA